MIDAEGQPFHDPEADAALFDALREGLGGTTSSWSSWTATSTTTAFADAMADEARLAT